MRSFNCYSYAKTLSGGDRSKKTCHELFNYEHLGRLF